jgi:hypothetical protein
MKKLDKNNRNLFDEIEMKQNGILGRAVKALDLKSNGETRVGSNPAGYESIFLNNVFIFYSRNKRIFVFLKYF